MNENSSELPEFRPPSEFNLKKLNLYEVFKNNLTFFLLIPTLVGGCYQIWQLTNIELSFIRFFSVSQVISDGLMILLGIVFLLFSIFYVGIILYILPKIKEIDSTKKKLFKISIIIFTTWFLMKLNINLNLAESTTDISIHLLCQLSLLIIILNLFYEIGNIIFLKYFKNENIEYYDDFLYYKFKQYKSKLEKIGLFLLSLVLLIISSSIHDLLLSFNNYSRVENFEIIEQQIKDNSLIEIRPKVVFYNKDYLFIDLNLVKSCGCNFDKNCTQRNIYENKKWIEHKYRVIDGKELIEVYK